jgi:hypothetical protein
MAHVAIASWLTDPYLLVLFLAIVGSLIVAFVGSTLLPMGAFAFKSRRVSCPESGSKAIVSMSVRPHKGDQLVACSLSPDGVTCSRDCLK